MSLATLWSSKILICQEGSAVYDEEILQFIKKILRVFYENHLDLSNTNKSKLNK